MLYVYIMLESTLVNNVNADTNQHNDSKYPEHFRTRRSDYITKLESLHQNGEVD